jgi:hypothetical protein
MKIYRINLIKNFKCGYLVLPLGVMTLFLDYIIFKTGFDYWQTIMLFCVANLVGLPGLLIHLYYFLHDFRIELKYDTKNDYFDFLKNGKKTRIYKKDVESLDKITKDGTMGRVPWGQFKMFSINLKNGERFSISNLTIDFHELFEIVKMKDRQLNTNSKSRIF